MCFDGYDLSILGAALGTGGSLILAKAYLAPSYLKERAATYWGSNPFQLKSDIMTRHEAAAGAIWFVASFAASLVGTFRTVDGGRIGCLVSSWPGIALLVALILLLGALTLIVTRHTSRGHYVPVLSGMMQDNYERHAHVVRHAGRLAEDVAAGSEPSTDVAARRLTEASEDLERIAILFDERRKPGESDHAFAARLAKYFPGARTEVTHHVTAEGGAS